MMRKEMSTKVMLAVSMLIFGTLFQFFASIVILVPYAVHTGGIHLAGMSG